MTPQRKGRVMGELKPCPFCGCDEICHASDEVFCESCFATICDTEHWNERTESEDLSIAKANIDKMITEHGAELGEKCRRILELELLVGKVREALDTEHITKDLCDPDPIGRMLAGVVKAMALLNTEKGGE